MKGREQGEGNREKGIEEDFENAKPRRVGGAFCCE
jgi:hypothetical protein